MANLCGSGGGGIPINGITPMLHTKTLATLEDGTSWLRSGNYETDITNYPDATSYPLAFSSVIGTTGVANTVINDIAVNSTEAFVLDGTTLYRYDIATMVSNGTSTVVAGHTGIGVDDSYVYLFVPNPATINIYDKTTLAFVATVAIGGSFEQAMDVNDTYMVVADGSTVYFYNKVSPYALSHSWTTPNAFGSGDGLSLDSKYVFHVDASADLRYLHDIETGTLVFTDTQQPNTTQICAKDTHYFAWDTGTDLGTLYSIIGGVGLKIASTDTDTGLPIYIRIL